LSVAMCSFVRATIEVDLEVAPFSTCTLKAKSVKSVCPVVRMLIMIDER